MKSKLLLLLLTVFFSIPAITFANDYVGSDKCFACHAEQYNAWRASGHSWKLRKIEKARYTKLPLPPGYN